MPKRPRPITPSEDTPNKRLRASSYTPLAEKPYPCDQCDLSYMNKSSLGLHKRQKHGNAVRFKCDLCNTKFERPEGVKNHIERKRCPVLLADGSVQRMGSLLNDRSTSSPLVGPSGRSYIDFLSSAATAGWASASRNMVVSAKHRFKWQSRRFDPDGTVSRFSSKPSIPDLPVTPEIEVSEVDSIIQYIGWRINVMHYVFDLDFLQFRFEQQSAALAARKKEMQLEQDKSRCTRPRPSYRWPFPPAFDYPPPQDLEDLLSQQGRLRRRLRVMESFQLTHRKLLGGQQMSEYMSFLPSESWDNRIMDHQIHLKQAWKDGVSAVREILSGTLPRELHSVLGAAQIAGAIRSAMDDADSPITSEATFLSDLSRWRLLLPSNCHAVFDYCANMLWDNIPPPALAWKELHDAETLAYFQDLLEEMLSHIESPPPERSEHQHVLPSSDAPSTPPAFSTHSPSSLECASDEVLPAIEDTEELQNSDNYKCTPLTELVLYSAGVIFALILVFILLYTGHFSVQVLCLYFITAKPPTHDAQDQPHRPQHGVLLVNCWLLQLLNQQLGLDRSSDDGTSIEDALDQEVQQPAMLGRLGWQQLIARCFEETAETAFIISAL